MSGRGNSDSNRFPALLWLPEKKIDLETKKLLIERPQMFRYTSVKL
jgi:hypothetical protein